MTDEQRDVRAEPAPFKAGALGGEIDTAASVRVGDNGRHPLRKERLPLSERCPHEPFSGVGVDVDEPWRDESVRRVNHRARLSFR